MNLPAAASSVKKFQGRKLVEAVPLSRIAFDEDRGNYKDILAKGHKLVSPVDVVDPVLAVVVRELATLKDCGNAMLMGVCQAGHEFGKVIRCGREWCATCGRLDSETHMRRYARILPKVQQMRSIGFFVIQFPVASRVKYRSKKQLSKVGTAVARWFKRQGFARGIRAWDWFGDPRCPVHHVPGEHQRQSGLYRCPSGCEFGLEDVWPEDMKFNPHLNILVDGGYLANLEELKAGLRSLLREPDLIVRYQFVESVPGMLHVARYAVKPTFHDVGWDFQMVAELVGFRSIWSWGRWDGEAVWSLEESESGHKVAAVVAMEGGNCAECGTVVTWRGVVNRRLMAGMRRMQDLGGGYWRIWGPKE